ncbi:hypothetical protein L7F22_021579 [Adiantum nelumboides]|nr:hypothetical protein [Adiantum nelumboides]
MVQFVATESCFYFSFCGATLSSRRYLFGARVQDNNMLILKAGKQFFSVSNVLQNMEGDVLQGLEKNLFQQFRGNADGTAGVNFGHPESLSPGAHSASSNRDFNPSDSEDSTKHQAPCVTIDSAALRSWYALLQERVVIGLCHGVRPSVEALKNWINVHWGSKNIRPSHVQYLPNNYYLFFFYNPAEALQVIGYGQWLIRNTPILAFKCSWTEIQGRGGVYPKWDPQLLIEIDLNKDLIYEVPIKDSDGNWLHSQLVTYRNLHNACFHCHKLGHHIKNCSEMATKDPVPEPKDDPHHGFQQVNNRNSMRQPKSNKSFIPKGFSFKVLLEDVFDPLNQPGKQFFSVSNVLQNMEGDVLQGLEKNLFQQFRGNADGTEGVNFGHSESLSPGAHSASSNRDFNPSDSEDSTKHQTPCVTIDSAALRSWYALLQERVVIGICHGVRPSVEALKNWINRPCKLLDMDSGLSGTPPS